MVLAREDATLSARVVARRALVYTDGPDPALDRPAHVRAASGLAWVGGRLAVIQDDAAFVALVDPASGRVDAVPLPADARGRRQHAKAEKIDLEACVALAEPERLLALGSGSTPRRERVAVVRFPSRESEVVEAPALFASLRARADFAGSALNIEGALLLDRGVLRLFNRGIGAPRAGVAPADASCDVDLADVLAGRAVAPRAVVRYDLGAIAGVRLTFTDVARRGDAVLYAAVAEDAPDAIRDGPIAGAAIGAIAGGEARWARLRDEAGAPLAAKIEGIAVAASGDRVFTAVDHDDPARASELLEVALAGAW